MSETTSQKLNPLLTSYIEQHRLVKSKERELETLKEQLHQLANKTIPKALTELGVASVKIDEGLQVAEFKPYREHNDQLLEPLYFYIRYWTSGGKSWHAPEISIEMEKPKPGMSCTDCPHCDSCSFKDYIDNPERTFQLEMSTPSKTEGELIMNQIKTVVNMAPNDCPRYKGSKFGDRLAAACAYGYLSIAMDAAFKEQHPYQPRWPHQPPCQRK